MDLDTQPVGVVDDTDVERIRRRDVPERRAYLVLSAVAIIAIAVAVLLNWLGFTRMGGFKGQMTSVPAGYTPSAAAINLTKDPKTMLPSSILGFESIAVQPVPGNVKTQAEGVYQTDDMRVGQQLATISYARVEGYASADAARARLAEVLAGFPLQQKNVMVNNVTPATVGYTSDLGSRITAWTNGPYLVYAKASFQDHVPAEKRKFLEVLDEQVSAAVEVFQRTGKEGTAASKLVIAPPPGAAGVESGLAQPGLLGSP